MTTLGPEVAVFRASFTAILHLSGFVIVVLLPLVIRSVHRAGWTVPVVAVGFGALLLVPVLLLALAAPAVRFFRVRVHQLGLRAFDAWGRFRSVRWTEMTGVERMDLPGMPYLRIRTREEGIELVVPLFLARRDAFVRAIARWAGPSHPVTRHLARRGGAG